MMRFNHDEAVVYGITTKSEKWYELSFAAKSS
jgi:hypothetical protein